MDYVFIEDSILSNTTIKNWASPGLFSAFDTEFAYDCMWQLSTGKPITTGDILL